MAKSKVTSPNKATEKAQLTIDVNKIRKSMKAYIEHHFGTEYKMSMSGCHYAMAAGLERLSLDLIKEVYDNTEKGNDDLCHITFTNFRNSILADSDLRDCFLRYIYNYQDINYEIPMHDADLTSLVNSIGNDIIFENKAENLLRFLISCVFSGIMRRSYKQLVHDKKKQLNDKHVHIQFELLFDDENKFTHSVTKFIETTMSHVHESDFHNKDDKEDDSEETKDEESENESDYDPDEDVYEDDDDVDEDIEVIDSEDEDEDEPEDEPEPEPEPEPKPKRGRGKTKTTKGRKKKVRTN